MVRNSFGGMRVAGTGLLTLAAGVLLAGGSALAQGTMNSQPPATGSGASSGSMNSAPNGSNSGSMNNPNSPMNASGGMGGGDAMGGASQDKMFAKKAMAGGMAEVQLGQLALQKSSSDDVKKFGQQMIDDHTKMNDQMKPIAAAIGVQPPADVMPKDKKVMTKLQALSGDDFDKAYIKAMLKDHMEDDKEFQMEASKGQNAQEKEAAAQGDQIVKQHLEMVKEMAKTHNVMADKKAM